MNRMPHLQFLSMQHWSRCVSLPVQPVSHQRMTDRGKVDPNLMSAAGQQLHTDHRGAVAPGQGPNVRDGSLSLVAHTERDRADPRQWCVDQLSLGQRAFADSQICLADVFPLKLPRQIAIYFGALCKKDDAAGSAIEPLHQESRFSEVSIHLLEQYRFVGVVATLNHHSSRLIDEDERVV